MEDKSYWKMIIKWYYALNFCSNMRLKWCTKISLNMLTLFAHEDKKIKRKILSITARHFHSEILWLEANFIR